MEKEYSGSQYRVISCKHKINVTYF